MTIALNDFVRRQTPESPYSHFEGTEDELIQLVCLCFHEGKQGYKPGVLLVPVPPERFRSSTVQVNLETPLRAVFGARREPEAPYLSVRAQGKKTQAKYAFVVLYSHAVLVEGNEATTDCDFEIVSINARESVEEEPMDPMTMARNFLVLEGGTRGDFTAQQFAESIVYWSTRALVDSPQPAAKKLSSV
jgi:hypothetical protein